jgi:GDP-4-dehydro-6-deoxy-D-mannose reductase
VPSFAAQIVRIERGRQRPAIRVGNLTIRRDFLDVRDVVDAYVSAIFRFDELPNGHAINIASGKPVSIGDILNNLVALAKITVEFVVDNERLRANDCPVTVGDASRARSLLGWMPRIELTEMLKSILDWHRTH